jgi:hypothetical protein
MAARGSPAGVPRPSVLLRDDGDMFMYPGVVFDCHPIFLFPSKPFKRVYRRCATIPLPRRGGFCYNFPSQIGLSPIRHLMRRRRALSRGTVPGGPVTSLPAFYLGLSGGRTTITLIRISRGPGPFTSHPTSNIAGNFPSSLPTPGYMRQRRLTPHPARTLLAPALTEGYTHPLHTSPSIQCRGDSTPAPLACYPLTNKPSHMLPCASRTWLRIR